MTRRQHGFTLIEILAAFAIAVASLGILWRILGQAGRATLLAARYQQAIDQADNLLDEAQLPARWPSGTHHGQIPPHFDFELRIEDMATSDPRASDPLPLQRIELTLRWQVPPSARQLTLHSLRPAPSSL